MLQEFADYCGTIGVRRSIGRTGICYDSGWAESFEATLKVERLYWTDHPIAYSSLQHAINDITRWIEL